MQSKPSEKVLACKVEIGDFDLDFKGERNVSPMISQDYLRVTIKFLFCYQNRLISESLGIHLIDFEDECCAPLLLQSGRIRKS